MNKADLIQIIADRTGESKAATGRNVEAILEAISGCLKSGNNVTLVGFGTFRVAKRAARRGVNPQTKAAIKIASAKVPRFVPGQALKAAVARGK